jgi:hypothetical protein
MMRDVRNNDRVMVDYVQLAKGLYQGIAKFVPPASRRSGNLWG